MEQTNATQWAGSGAVQSALGNQQQIAHEHQLQMQQVYLKNSETREDQELRLKCLQTTLQFANGDMAKATNSAQIAYDFITGKRSLSEVSNGVE